MIFRFILAGFLILSAVGCGKAPPTTLTVAMSLGEEEWKVMRVEIFPVFVKTEEETRMKPGEIVFLNIDPARMYFFDQSGKRM